MPSRRVPPERRKRTEISCDKCKSRKQKCHRLLSELRDGYDSRAPCRYCQTHGFECVTTQLRKKRVLASVEESLEARVALLESLVKGLVPGADTSSVEGLHALGASLGIPLPEAPEQQQPSHRHGSGTPAGIASERAGTEESSGKAVESRPAAQTARQQHDEANRKGDEQLPVLRDQLGQMQYIGPASSYIFQIRMRAILAGRNSHYQSQGQFFLFGSNPTDKAWVGKVAGLGREMKAAAGRDYPLHPVDRSLDFDGSEVEDNSDDEEEDERFAESEDWLLSGALPDRLVDAFFERVHPDFPVLCEEGFRQKYERFRQQRLSPPASGSNTDVDASWVCSFLCILILARRTVPPGDVLATARGQEAEDRWWRKVQAVLPSVLFTSCIAAVQALLLASLHLNNTNSKDSCWTLTGAAARIAIAIGLHRDAKCHHHHSPHEQQQQQQQHGDPKTAAATPAQDPMLLLRKRIWWTLYQFELMQAASLDRPSAIDDAACNTRAALPLPAAAEADATAEHSTRLLKMFSQACRVVRAMNHSSANGETVPDAHTGPLSPAASLIRDMRRWRDGLPRALSPQAAIATHNSSNSHSSGPGQEQGRGSAARRSRRALLLLHVQYHHILCVVTRNPMLTTVSQLFDNSSSSSSSGGGNNTDDDDEKSADRRDGQTRPSLGVPEGDSGCNAYLSDVCIDAAQASARLLFRLDAAGLFDPVLWWDFYFVYQAAQVLVLGVLYDAKRNGGGSSSRLETSRALLQGCAELAGRVARNPLVPGTILRFAVVVRELVGLVEGHHHQQQPLQEQQQQPLFHGNNMIGDANAADGNAAPSQMDIVDDDATATFENHIGLMHGGDGGDDDLAMAETPSDIQFPADMAAHFGFPDGSWTYREGQWNDFSSMIMSGGYGT
ncbi:hypothetical protein PG999_003109 [Apiospora kogelbergensis]|uniref:Zn(2)-C6 fungal-type domain-containing protein n=1 Tax=Apiospora kogelbergensis TaxID=1337665 RepID=A0AAW0RAA3_9PEZI